jgi:hypothetical protein
VPAADDDAQGPSDVGGGGGEGGGSRRGKLAMISLCWKK